MQRPGQLREQCPTRPPPTQHQSPPPAATKKHSTAEDNPFPEEYSKEAAKAADKDPAADAPPTNPTTTQPSATPGGGSSSQQGLDKLDLYGDKQQKRGSDPNAGLAYDPKLAAQDDKIGDFYLKNGNAPGAYSRFKDRNPTTPGTQTQSSGLAEPRARRKNARRGHAAISDLSLRLSRRIKGPPRQERPSPS